MRKVTRRAALLGGLSLAGAGYALIERLWRQASSQRGGDAQTEAMSESKAMILASSGSSLNRDEKSFFRDERPWGFIVFARNIREAAQLSDLVAEMRDCVGWHAPVFIDQEGGRIQRLRPPLAPDYPSASEIGEIFEDDPDRGIRAAWIVSRLHAFDLLRYGINADCLPVLDLPIKGSHRIIGDRAYGLEPEVVQTLGRSAMEGLIDGGVLPVVKHIPGHGRATVDSHKELPVVEASLDDLADHDFQPFRALKDAPMAMTAHVVYSAIDPNQPATTSVKVIEEIIRGHIGYDGLLMTDDLHMSALSSPFMDRAARSFDAGCDMALHCSGDFGEMVEVARGTPEMTGIIADRAERAIASLRKPDDTDEAALRDEFEQIFGRVG